MKKCSVLLLTGLACTALLFGCGKTEEEPQEENQIELENEVETETGEETEPVEESREGMVRNPATNEWMDESLDNQRPIAVMYPINKQAQPQYGLNKVDIFYEIMEEGDMSRQMGILTDWKELEQIGNIRSIRDYFVYAALEWDPIIVHFGGPELYVSDILLRKDVENINGTGGSSMGSDYGAFFRIPAGSKSEHTAYTDSEHILSACEKADFSLEHRDEYYVKDHFQFAPENSPNTLDGGEEATEIDMSQAYPVTKSSLSYNPEDGLYYKTLYGQAHCDAVTGEQLAFANVIVQNTYFEVRDAKGYLAFRMHDTSGRDGYFFTQGKVIPITWTKENDYEPTRYFDEDGNEIVLNTGKTMIFVVKEGDKTIYK